VNNDFVPFERKPSWLKVPLPGGKGYFYVRDILRQKRLHTVCEEGNCPNRAECFGRGTATFLILGDVCTRRCLYCNVKKGHPHALDRDEPRRVVEAVKELKLDYVVITSVTRDDLPDGGAGLFAEVVRRLREEVPGLSVEVLIPDFGGDGEALEGVIEAGPEVINHNIECVPSLFPLLRPQGSYRRSLNLLKRVADAGKVKVKSGLMVGLGEEVVEIEKVLQDLLQVNCKWVTIGQYQQPTKSHWPVRKYYRPEEFDYLGQMARSLGFEVVAAGPLVRSSYRASFFGGKDIG